MNAQQEAWLNMYKAVISFCNSQPAITASVPAFAAGLSTLQVITSNITDTAAKQLQATSGVRNHKENQRITLSRLASTIGANVFAWASAQQNHLVKEEVRYSFTKLRRLPDEKLAPVCKNIHKAASDNQAQLAAYGITAATLTGLQSTINTYQSAVAGPRNAVSLGSAYVQELKKLFSQANSLLKNQLDKIALQFKITHPDFYNAYSSNRIIVDAPTSHTKIAGIITNANKEPVSNVSVTVVDKEYKAETNAGGKFSIKIPVPGTYTLRCSKEGFTELTLQNILLKLGKTKRIRIKMSLLTPPAET